jgi:hypothetical protein
MLESNPIYIFIVAIVLTLVVGLVIYSTNFIVSGFNAAGNTISGYNATRVNTTYTNVFTIAENSIVLILIIALLMDPIVANYKPVKLLGYVNILFIFIVPYIFINVQPALLSLSTFNSGTGITPLLYSFVSSVYFITLVEVVLVIAAILNFRHIETHELYSTANDVYQYDRLDR